MSRSGASGPDARAPGKKPRRVCAAAAALDESAPIAQRIAAVIKDPALLERMDDRTHHQVIEQAIIAKYKRERRARAAAAGAAGAAGHATEEAQDRDQDQDQDQEPEQEQEQE
jgi:hypothetical protein